MSLEQELRRFERQEWGTNDPSEIRQAIERQEWQRARDRMTGMDEEQANWDSDDLEAVPEQARGTSGGTDRGEQEG